MTTAHVSGGAAASGPIRHLLSSSIQQFHKIRGRYFNADCATHAIKSPRCHLSKDNARPLYCATFPQQCLQGYDVLPWPARSPDLSPIEHARAGKATAAVPRYRELTAQMQKTMAGSSTGGHK
ncbi:uncharacterized protein TNCV_4356911 [Trichonephila clavipes]|nr:uncharacterized protein TNCV_4356911 [Trichonephila clavipes]